jgi:hypothetical protein
MPTTRPAAPPDAAPAEPCVCSETVDNLCCEFTPNKVRIGGYRCTRPKGHDGDHVACGGEGFHRLATWPQAAR